MGAWFRLRADYPETGLSPYTVAVVEAMKHHGLVLADNGSPWYFQGTADTRWPDRLISELKRIPASAFVAVDVASLRVSANSGQAKGLATSTTPVVLPTRPRCAPTQLQGRVGACS
jgi:hypothetical protein